MGIKNYKASRDNTITNGYKLISQTRATGSNMGAADILEVYSIYGQQTTSSAELSRVLVQFPITTVSSDRTAGTIPASGSVNFFLRMFNARHSEQLPRDFTVNVLAVSQSWQEGYGLDMDGYSDLTDDKIEGSNWMNRNSNPAASWAQVGGDYHSSSYIPADTMPNYTFTFSDGDEDLLVDVTAAVEEWIAGTQTNNGFGIFLTSSQEAYVDNITAADSVGATGESILLNTEGQKKSFYTKRFFSRTSEFFFKRPTLEARWDSRIMDDRGNFYYSSSLAPAEDNLNTIYLYNYVRGRLKNIPNVDTGLILVSIYSGSSSNIEPSGSKLELSAGGGVVAAADLNVTGGYVSTGVYSASFAFTGSTSLKTIYDVWHSSSVEYVTSSINPNSLDSPGWNQYPQFTTKITNLKPSYSEDEIARFRVFVRERNSTPTIYAIANSQAQGATIPSASFEVFRNVDNETIINNSTGSSTRHTFLSYDNSGSYFDLNMSLLEPGYMYGIRLMFYSSDGWREQEETFNFRVENS
jgi:hypothetical protein